ncbi:hypothetical protein LJB42_004225 [Komagataella kurtzmanii]|nr:hypothetical protein LJB42_004225 [Komagataella kurtzmanii]
MVSSTENNNAKKTLVPGTVVILLVGRFSGKRVVYLKTLEDNTLLVTGPFKINGVPLKQVSAEHVIVTSTKVSMEGVDVSKFDASYFNKEGSDISEEKSESDFFGDETEKKSATPEQIEDQKSVDKVLLEEIKKISLLSEYLAAPFSLKKGDRPHEMVF